MDTQTVVTMFVAVFTAFGGVKALEYFNTRKAARRKSDADAKDAEINTHEKQIERYEARLINRDAKVDKIYMELRESQREVLKLTHALDEANLKIHTMELQKCEIRGCPNRQPPGSY